MVIYEKVKFKQSNWDLFFPKCEIPFPESFNLSGMLSKWHRTSSYIQTLSYWRSSDVCRWWSFHGNESVFPSVEFYCNVLSLFSQLFKTLSHTKPNLTSCQNDVICGRKVPHCAMSSSERFRSIVEDTWKAGLYCELWTCGKENESVEEGSRNDKRKQLKKDMIIPHFRKNIYGIKLNSDLNPNLNRVSRNQKWVLNLIVFG